MALSNRFLKDSMQSVYVIILNWNGWRDTIECVDSVKLLRHESFLLNIVIVDNGSTDDSYSQLVRKYPSIPILQSKKNSGFSGGNNIGITYALSKNADYICILNNDTVVHKNLLEEILKVASQTHAGIVSPKIYFAKGFEFHKERYPKDLLGKAIWYAGGEIDWKNVYAYHRGVDAVDKGQFDTEAKTDFASGCAMLVCKSVFEKIGLFDETYFLYFEDSDLSQRAIRKGFSIYFAPKAFLWHKNAASAGGSGSSLQDYYISRNRMLFGMMYAPWQSKIALFRESVKLLLFGRKWQKRGILDFYLFRFGKGSYR